MRFQIALLCTLLACLATSNLIEAKNVYRRADKISEHFKQINLAEDEIDPNVAPEPPKIEHVETEDVDDITGTAQPEDEVIDEAALEALNNADTSANEIISANGNEVEPVAAPAAAVVPTAAPVSSTSPAISSTTPVKNEDDPSAISKYCKCSDTHCDCCRTFGLPLIPIRGPGCAKITYLGDEKMSVSIKYGDVTLATRTISGKKAKPICVGLPGGYSKFCGRVYGLSKSKENFKACLGFELRAEDEIEAALRVSCFKFGPEGLRVADAEPLPSEVNKGEDDDDDDIFGFGAGGDDDDDDYDADEDEEDDEDDTDTDADTDDDEEYGDDTQEAPEEADYGGFSLGGLLDELDDDEDEVKPTVAKPVATPAVDQTRTVQAGKEKIQSKEDKGSEAAPAEGSGVSAVEEAIASVVTPATPEAVAAETTKKGKTKKAKKNKKKKAASAESDFAYEFLKGILDFFE